MFRPLTEKALNTRPQRPIIGFIFKENEECGGQYYKQYANGYTVARSKAYIYSLAQIEKVMRNGGTYCCWGCKSKGHWIAVYARTQVAHSYGGY